MKKRFSILCCGRIAETMASTVEKMEEAELYAVAARDLNRARAFAEKHGFQKYYGSYEELAADEGSDLIYIASPHSHHEELVRLCLEHGRNVLCEKPLTVNRAKAEGLFQLAKSRGLFLMEAMWTRFLPSIHKMRELLDGGAIGEPVSLVVSFGGNVQGDPRLNSPELAGGALLDTGVYLLTMAELVFGTNPEEIVSSVVKTPLGVDGLSTVVMKFPGGKQATLVDSIVCPLDNRAIIYGGEGYLELENFYGCQKISVFSQKRELVKCYDIPFDFTGYEYEVRAAFQALERGETECPGMPAANTLRILEWTDRLRSEWGVRYPFE